MTPTPTMTLTPATLANLLNLNNLLPDYVGQLIKAFGSYTVVSIFLVIVIVELLKVTFKIESGKLSVSLAWLTTFILATIGLIGGLIVDPFYFTIIVLFCSNIGYIGYTFLLKLFEKN